MDKKGLKDKFETEPSFNMHVRMIHSLALIDPKFIDASHGLLKERSEASFTGPGYEGINAFNKYFEQVTAACS